MVAELQEEGEDELRHRRRSVLRHVDDRDPVFARRTNVDVVEPGGADGDQPEIRKLLEVTGRHADLVDHENRRRARPRDERISWCPLVDREIAQTRQPIPGIVPRIQRVAVEDDNGYGALSTHETTR